MIISRLLPVFIVFLFAGCVPINQNVLLDTGTKVELIDISSESLAYHSLVKKTDDINLIKLKLMQVTKDELKKRSIEAVLEPTKDAAKLKYDIHGILAGYKGDHEIRYKVILENKAGMVIFEDGDEKDGSSFDDVLNQIARRVSGYVASSFK